MDHKTKRRIKNNLWGLLKWWAYLSVGGTVLVMILIGVFVVAANTSGPAPASPAGAPSLPLPVGTSPSVRATVDAAWPKVLTACPGLQRYGADLTYQGIEETAAYAPNAPRRVSILLRVSDHPIRIPAAYIAQGHTCFFEVSDTGQALVVHKRPCAALCLDDAAALSNQPETVIGLQ